MFENFFKNLQARLDQSASDPVADLAARKVKFDKSELQNMLYSAGGGYLTTVNGEDVRTARSMFGHLWGKPARQTVGYLVPAGNEVLVQIKGKTVDRLTRESAIKTLKKIDGPTPIKIQVQVIENRKDSRWDRPHFVLMTGTTPPK